MCLTFSAEYPDTRLELEEFVLSGGNEMLLEDSIDIPITPTAQRLNGEHVHRSASAPVTSPQHPLQHLARGHLDDLTAHRQVVLRDSSRKRRSEGGWLGAHQRWTVTHTSTRAEYCPSRSGLCRLRSC